MNQVGGRLCRLLPVTLREGTNMKNAKTLLLVLCSALLLLVVGTAGALPPRITWNPNPLVTEEMAPGDEASYSVTLKNTGLLPILAAYQLQIVAEGAIVPYVTIAQPKFPNTFKRGQAVTFNVKVSVPDKTPAGEVKGNLVLKRFIRNKVVDVWRAEALPVTIRIKAVELTPANQAVLGPLAGAEINAYRLSSLITPVEGPIVATPSLTDPALAGTFRLALAGVPDDEWVLVTATGGQDIDADDNGILDTAPTTNLGTLHALAKASDWRAGDLRINVLTEIAWQALALELELGQIDDLDGRLRWIANQLLEGDVTADGDLDYRDLTAFDPLSEGFRNSLDFPFAAFLAEDEAGRSFFDEIHAGQDEAVRDWIAAFFGDKLQTPRAPEIVDVVTEIHLPTNRAGIQGQDLLVSSVVSSGAQILDQGATLMLAKDAAGRPVLLAFALPGETAQFSPRSTALALVMLYLGSPRDADAFVNLASKVAAESGFDPLVVSTQNTLAADPFFLDRLANYFDLVDQIKAIVASVKAAVAIPPDPPPTVAAPLALPQPMSLTADLTAEQSLPIAKDGFYCIPWVKCSPWHESQPWDWYGDAKGAEALWPDSLFDVLASVGLGYYTVGTGAVAYLSLDAYVEILSDFTHIPFLAVPQENQTEIGLANPGAATVSG